VKVPVANIYNLLCYAWDKLQERDVIAVAAERETRLLDLFARVLVSGCSHLLKRGLDRGYVLEAEEIPGIRGRLDLATSARRIAFPRGRAVCQFDELSYDVVHNRIIKATLRNLLAVRELDRELSSAARALWRRFESVGDVELTPALFRMVQLHRNNAIYDFLLRVCLLLREQLVPVGDHAGGLRFRDFTDDQQAMGHVFQAFLFNYLKRHQDRYRVRSNRLEWQHLGSDDSAVPFLPEMRTDITLSSKERVIIAEAKFTPSPFQSQHGKRTLRSDHLYQLFAYLRNGSELARGLALEGLLVYPAAEASLSLRLKLDGYLVSVRTVDLSSNWPDIEAQVLALVS
jgi:5-methylcytosine-specific restriction enzyme subunit McrC